MKIDGRYLKDLRIKNNFSLRAFAKKIYASKSSVQRWEVSSPPDDDELIERIANVYNLTAAELKRQSDAKYGEESISPEKLAELKFGVKGLIFPIAIGLSVISLVCLSVLLALIFF